MIPEVRVMVGAFVLVTASSVGVWPGTNDKEPRAWDGAIDLRRALRIQFSQVCVDSELLSAAAIDPHEFLPPHRTKAVNPVYPDSALRSGAQGRVTLVCLIRASGTVDACVTVESVHHELDRAAAEAIGQWKFEPARVGGLPRDVLATFQMVFRAR